LRIKSYFADTIEEAMDKARIELGPDAMLMNSRRSTPEASRQGAYEVVFAVDRELPAQRARAAYEERAAGHSGTVLNDNLATELAELRRQIEGVKQSVSRQTVHLRWSHGASTEAAEVYSRLVQAGFSDEMVQDLMRSVHARLRPPAAGEAETSIEVFADRVKDELRQRIRVSPGLGREGSDRSVVMFVGAPGSGKTATLAKLAIGHCIQAARPVQLISADYWRVGASEQLRSYAAILGVGFETADTIPALAQALHLHAHKTVLVDTPGMGADDMEMASELAQFCQKETNIEVQLVLPAHARGPVLARIADRFACFRPARLIATFLDEADTLGGILEQAMRIGLPLSYTSSGQQVPEDLQPADHENLLTRVLDGLPQAVLSMA
jgi:flagellar biosynthesis protein FlhF